MVQDTGVSDETVRAELAEFRIPRTSSQPPQPPLPDPMSSRRRSPGGRAHQGLYDRHGGLRPRRQVRPPARLDRAHRGGSPPPVARTLLSHRRPDEPPAHRIPRGGYAPVFGTPRPWRCRRLAAAPRVLVTAFEEEGDQSSFPTFTRGFTRSLLIALTRFTGLRVFGAEPRCSPRPISSNGARLKIAADYLVTGQTSLRPDGFQVDVLLVEVSTGRSVWAETFERHSDPDEIIEALRTTSRTASRGRWPRLTVRSSPTAHAMPTGGLRRRLAAMRRCCSSTPIGEPSTRR